jgi:hypothetical protein
MFFRLGEAKWQHCPTRSMLVTSSSVSSVSDTKNGDFYFRRTARDFSTCVARNPSKLINGASSGEYGARRTTSKLLSSKNW